MRHLAAVPLLFALMLINISSAQSSCALSLSASNFTTFIGMALIGIALSFLLIALTYMIGEVLNYSALKGWYKTELWEVTKSILVIVIVFSSIVIASAIVNMLVGYTASTQISSSSSLFNSMNTNLQGLCSGASSYLGTGLSTVYVDFATMLGISQGIGSLKSIVFGTWFPLPVPLLPVPVLSIQFGSVAKIYTSSYIETLTPMAVFSFIKDMFSMVLFPLFYLFQFQYDFIGTIIAVGLVVLLPIGIVFRALPFTRGIGGTFIAIGIGASLIYPALLVGFNAPISSYLSSITPAPPVSSSAPSSSGLGQIILTSITNFASAPLLGTLILPMLFGTPSVNNYPNLGDQMQTGYKTGYSAGFYEPLTSNIVAILNVIIDQTIYMIMQLFLFIFDLIIGLAIVNQIARLLGGTMSLSKMGVGRMKLT